MAEDFVKISSETRFTQDECRLWYDEFRTQFPAGHITELDLERMFSGRYPAGNAQEYARNVFRAFDVDGDGSINFREYVTSLSTVMRGDVDEKLHWAFSVYDVDGNGWVTRDDVRQLISVRIIVRPCCSLVESSRPFQPDHLGLNPARSTECNRVITVGR